MPDKRLHRGPHPDDARLFGDEHCPRLRDAVADLSWLYGRGYTQRAGLKLVGDRYSLRQRQRLAVMRSACSDEAMVRRQRKRLNAEALAGRSVAIDGYNVLITIEAAMAGGVLLLGRDGCLRDLASMHGTFRTVTETRPALKLVGEHLAALGAQPCMWYLDRPVSNSGRLRDLMLEVAADRGWEWRVELVNSPDKILRGINDIVATADSVILDHCQRWYNLARGVVNGAIRDARTMDLSPQDRTSAGNAR